MNKLLLTVLFVGIFLLSLSSVSAIKIDYSENELNVSDMIVHIYDTILFGLIKTGEQGTMELTSHSTPYEIKRVGLGNQITMIYDIDFEDTYSDALGDVTFIDKRTGEEIERDWKFVYWGNESYESPVYSCKDVILLNGTTISKCTQTGTEIKVRETWLDYDSRDIPQGRIRIGLMTDVKLNDYVDGIWEVQGEEIEEHAVWEYTADSHGYAQTSSGTVADDDGVKIEMNKDASLFNVTLASGCTATKSSLWYGNGTKILDISVTSEVADFSPYLINLTSGQSYYITADNDGSDYTRKSSGAIGFPTAGTNLDWTGYGRNGGDLSSDIYTNIKTITTGIIDYDAEPVVILNSPENEYNSSTNAITFNATAYDADELTEVYFYLNGVLNETNSSGINNSFYYFTKTFDDGDYNWTVGALNNDSQSFNANTRNFTIDTTNVLLSLSSPNITYDYLKKNETIYLTGFANDTNLDTCWYEYDSTNTTFSCTTEVQFNESINISDETTLILWANDSVGRRDSYTTTWGYRIFENNYLFNSTSYQTKTELFIINITANNSLSDVKLMYNGTEYSTTQSGKNYSTNLDIPLANVGNNSIRWKFTYAGSTIYSNYYYQNISETRFTICNTTYTTMYLNVSFKDEEDLSSINATIPTSNFVYYLGNGLVNKTYTFSNTTENYYYDFCASPSDLTFYIDPYIQYKQGTDYPQRVYDAGLGTYTNQTTNLTLYLLNVVDGIYVTFQVINVAEQPISGISVNATREISGEDVLVADGTTDASGSVTFWLNPDFQHIITFSGEGYDTTTYTITPTQTTYTITLGETTTTTASYVRGITELVKPIDDFLDENESYIFNYTINSTYWDLTEYGFSLYWENTTLITSTSGTTSTGGILASPLINLTGNNTYLYMEYYYLVNSTYTNGTRSWYIQGVYGRQFSIFRFFTDTVTYMDSGNFFGMDGFGKALLSVIILVMVAGGASLRYGVRSDTFIAGIVFGLVLLLDYGLNFLPPLRVGGALAVDNFFSIIAAIMLIFIIIREERL